MSAVALEHREIRQQRPLVQSIAQMAGQGASDIDLRQGGLAGVHQPDPARVTAGDTSPAQRRPRESRRRTVRLDSKLPVDLARKNALSARSADDDLFAPQHTSTALLPDPGLWVQRYALALVEALAGRRSPSQLTRHSNADVLARIQRRHRTAVRRGGAAGLTGVRRVQICLPCDGVVEAAVVARVNGRLTPIALRLNGVDGRWQVTVLEAL